MRRRAAAIFLLCAAAASAGCDAFSTPVVICPGFGNDSIDYEAPLSQPREVGFISALERRGFDPEAIYTAGIGSESPVGCWILGSTPTRRCPREEGTDGTSAVCSNASTRRTRPAAGRRSCSSGTAPAGGWHERPWATGFGPRPTGEELKLAPRSASGVSPRSGPSTGHRKIWELASLEAPWRTPTRCIPAPF